MRIAAYQFPVSGSISANLRYMRSAVAQAAAQGVKLLVFPECAATGYPPRDIPSPGHADFEQLHQAYAQLQVLADQYALHILTGGITKAPDGYRNSALFFAPGEPCRCYHKRALWGWDADHFLPGHENGIFELDGWRIGVRICYEVRFPEYFRELYRARTDLDILLFYDVTDSPQPDRYDLIRAHIRTRATENAVPFLTVNTTAPFQTAPTGAYSASGAPLKECTPGQPALLFHDFERRAPDFGELGRITISDRLVR